MGKRPPQYDLPNAAPEPLRLVQLFLNTSNHETGRELLGTPAQLASWLGDQGLEAGPVRAADVRRAQLVRSALREFVSSDGPGAALKEAASRARLTVDLESPRLFPLAQGLDGALGMIVAASYDAIRDGSWSRLKACRNCEWIYWDRSKNRSAAWCSMQLCGSRLKVRRYRRRRGAVA